MTDLISPWTILDRKDVYNNPWIAVTEYDVINPSGGRGIYGKVHFKNLAVGVIAIDHEMNSWLVGQYRFVLDEYSWEIPEGGAPEATDALASAKRELLEETGLLAGNWQLIMKMHLSNSVSDELAFIYLATELQEGIPEPEETEKLELRKLSFETLYQMVKAGTLTDSITVAAVLKIKLMMLEKEIKF